MTTEQQNNDKYVLGHADHEIERLSRQAQRYEQFTRAFFHDAGMAEGMRVLDVGSGGGDVSFLIAQIVGPTGQIVGFDPSSHAVATATQRAQSLGLTNTHFITGDASNVTFAEPFDAVVGRFVLQFMPDPVAALRRLASFVRPGGIIAFQEMDNSGCHAFPPVPTISQCMQWLITAMEQSGADPRSGLKLWARYQAAGLPLPTLSMRALVGAGPEHPIYEGLAGIMRSLLPTLEAKGIATAQEVDVETLAQRIGQEVSANQATVVGQNLIGAFVRTPAA
ncbi:MAG: methyltransferase domain-containing protein [Ktedonobacterales bacterium]|nr:methyltransferase domain-containing protein [Ktedonobacterales bacterium]